VLVGRLDFLDARPHLFGGTASLEGFGYEPSGNILIGFRESLCPLNWLVLHTVRTPFEPCHSLRAGFVTTANRDSMRPGSWT